MPPSARRPIPIRTRPKLSAMRSSTPASSSTRAWSAIPTEVLALAKRLWTPGLKLIIVTYVPDPVAQQRLYHDLHTLCS